MAIPVQIEIEHGPDDKCRERASAQVSPERGRAGKEDSRIPQVELASRKSAVEQPDDGWGQGPNHEAVQHWTEIRRCEETFGSNEGIHDTLCVIALKVLSGPLARWIGLRSCDIVVFRGKHPPHHAVVDRKSDNEGKKLDSNYVARWNVEVVSNLHSGTLSQSRVYS